MDAAYLLSQTGFLRALARELVRDPDAAEDLVQETLVTALEHPPEREITPGGWRAWLATVLRHRAERRSREADARRAREQDVARAEATHPAHGEVEERMLRNRKLAQAVLALPDPYRAAVILRWLEGRTPREIAALQGISYDAARQRLSRATAMLRARLDQGMGERRTWTLLPWLSAFDRGVARVHPRTRWSWPASVPALAAGVLLFVTLGLALHGSGGGRGSVAPSEALASVTAPSARDVLVAVAERPREPVSMTAAPAPPAAPRAGEQISGLVVDARGAVLAECEVRVFRDPTAEADDLSIYVDASMGSEPELVHTTRTDAAGRFAVSVPPGRPFALEVRTPGCATRWLAHRYAGEDVRVTMEPGAVLAGRVLAAADRAPVAGAEIRGQRPQVAGTMLDRRAVFETTTDAFGRFRVDDLPSGDVLLLCVPGREKLPPRRTLELRAGAMEEIEILTETSASVVGRVIDAGTGLAIAGAEVGAEWTLNRAVRTDQSGEYELVNFYDSGYTQVVARAEGYGCRMVAVPPRARGTPGSVRLDLVLERARSVSGRVLAADGSPLSKAWVLAVGTRGVQPDMQMDWRKTTTDGSGRFTLRDLRRDLVHVVQVRKDGFGSASIEVPDTPDGEPGAELGDIVLAGGSLVRGEILDTGGNPVADQLVVLHGGHLTRAQWSGDDQDFLRALTEGPSSALGAHVYLDHRNGRTDERGRFAFADVPPGIHTIAVQPRGAQAPLCQALEVDAAQGTPLARLTLERGLAIAGRVAGRDGRPAVSALVRLLGADQTTVAEEQTDDLGRFLVSGLAPGAYRVQVLPYAGLDARALLAPRDAGWVRAGEHDVLVTVLPGRRVAGVVRTSDGGRARDTRIVLGTGDASDERLTIPCVDGRFEIVVPAGRTAWIRAEDDVPPSGRASESKPVDDASAALELVLIPR